VRAWSREEAIFSQNDQRVITDLASYILAVFDGKEGCESLMN